MKPIAAILPVLLLVSCARSQDRSAGTLVGGPCDGCEAIFEYGDLALAPVDTLVDFHGERPQLRIGGTVYESDGVTPAAGVILYVYHTNQAGFYPTRGDEPGWARRHGALRGWVRTGADGTYAFYTLKPGPYPTLTEPAHVHFTVLEPDGRYYYLDGCFFADDPLLDAADLQPTSVRGGGPLVLDLHVEDGTLVATRDIVLGENVPGYR